MRKLLTLLFCLAMYGMARGQTNTYEYRYWFDDQGEAVVSGYFDTSGGHIDVLTEGLDDKPHILHIQVKDTAGVWSSPVNHMFQKQTIDPAGSFTYHIWANENTGRMNTGTLDGDTLHLDMSHLPDGIHQLYVQVSQNGIYSEPKTKTFIKLPHAEGMGYLFCMMNIDGKPFRMERLPMSGGAASWVIDTDSLVTGIHRYTIMAITPTGYATSIREGFFVRENMASQLANQHCCYHVDGGEAVVVDGQVSGDQYHFDLDMSDIANGLHKLTYWMVSDNGATTEIRTSLFIKIPLGGTGVKAYDYWLNDDFDNRHTTTLSKTQNPFKLISLLPVETVPLRSSNFKFAFKDEQPVIYAQNDFHVRFLDAGDRYVETTKQFVDEKVWEEVVPVGEIQPTQTFDRIEENGIRWYTVTVEEGDTVAFKTSQACTLQLFSPSGEEVYQANGEFSVAFGGCHTWQTGTYYLAVHNVVGSQSIMTLSYMHMDKYDIASQDVHVVGNGGCSTITFKGNGFRDLYEVELTGPDGNIIESQYIGHESDAETSVIFDFTDVALGEYDAVFHFAEGDKSLSQMLTVEEAVDIELATNVSFPESFLRGTSVTYTIEITNKGNMTAYQVPLELQLIVNTIDDITSIKYGGDLKSWEIPDNIVNDSIDDDLTDILKSVISKSNDLSQFVVYSDTLSGIDYGLSQIIVNIPPNSTKLYYVTVESNSTVSLFVYSHKDWIPISTNISLNSRRKIQSKSREWMCCQRERFECAGEVVARIVGLVLPPGANCGLSLALTGLETAYDVWCSEGNSASEKWNNFLKSQGKSLANRLVSSAVSCVTAYFNLRIKELKDDRYMAELLGSSSEVSRLNNEIAVLRSLAKNIIGDIYRSVKDFVLGKGCVEAFTKTKPGCPPPPPGGGSSSPVNSCEPNEIYGTTSPSGSICLTDSVETVNYRIQFENDSVFATAAAQTVIVRDTLDTRYLDLSTFAPTFVKIADDMYEVDGSPNFVKTIDMRPRINTIVQVNCDLDEEKGIATWTFRSLDPMTMEPVTDVERGFLPVNYDGISGIGEVAFDIGLKQPLPNGTEISNRSGNIFDSNEPVMTPYWTNIIDAVAPESAITSYHIVNDSTMTLRFNGIDNLSGVWKYDVYACYGEAAAPFRVAEDVTENECDVRIYQGIVHGFFVVATDSAGNREQKFAPEVTIPIGSLPGDANGDGAVNVSDVMLMVSNILGDHSVMYIFENADVNCDGNVNVTDVMSVVDMILNGTASFIPQHARTALDDHLYVDSKGGRGTIHLVGDERYTGCQLHVWLPEGCELKDISINSACGKDHEMACRDLGGGHYSVVVYSLQAKEFEGVDTPLLDLTVEGIHADDVVVSNVLCTNRQFESVVMGDAGHDATGISTTSVDSKGEKTYDTQGVEVNTPVKGVYIKRGKKVVVH